MASPYPGPLPGVPTGRDPATDAPLLGAGGSLGSHWRDDGTNFADYGYAPPAEYGGYVPGTQFDQAEAARSRRVHRGNNTSRNGFIRDFFRNGAPSGRASGRGPGEGLGGHLAPIATAVGRAVVGEEGNNPAWIRGLYGGWAEHADTRLNPGTGNREIRKFWDWRLPRRIGEGALLGAVSLAMAPVAAPIAATRGGIRFRNSVRTNVQASESAGSLHPVRSGLANTLLGRSDINPREIAPPILHRYGTMMTNLAEGRGKYASLGFRHRVGAFALAAFGPVYAGIAASVVASPLAIPAMLSPVVARASRYAAHNPTDVQDFLTDGVDVITDSSETWDDRLGASAVVAGAAIGTAPGLGARGARWAARNPRAAIGRLLGGRADPVVPAHLRSHPLGQYLTGQTAVEIARDSTTSRGEKVAKVTALVLATTVASPYTGTAVTARAARFAVLHPRTAGRNTLAAAKAAGSGIATIARAVKAKLS